MSVARRAAWLPPLLVLALAVPFLGGCAAPARRADSADLAAQLRREAALEQAQRWGLVGRIAFFDGNENGSGRIEWRQSKDRFEILLAAPVSRQSWRLRGDAGGATLEGLEGGPRRARSAERLLADEAGWSVPLANLRAWARGLRVTSGAELHYGEDGLPARLLEQGWTVEYRDWLPRTDPPMPRRVFAQRGDTRVRLVVERWLAPEEVGALRAAGD